MQIKNFSADVLENPLLFIHDYYSLAAFLRLLPYKISHALHKKDELVSKVMQKEGRVTYKSHGSLEYTQKNLRALLEPIQQSPEFDHIWSYKKGVNTREKARELTGAKWLIHFDIKKYFDTINFKHITEALQHVGFSYKGAKLVTRLATVRRRGKNTLQQGSSVSGELSNIVGYYFFDRHILAKLKELKQQYPRITYQYMRYCDNVYLALWGDIDINVIRDYCAYSREVVHNARFRAHKWAIVPSNHPTRNQKILGIVVNHQARIEKEQFEATRATLFNACTKGLDATIHRFIREKHIDLFKQYSSIFDRREAERAWFKKYMQGKIAYINSISKKQGLQLKKLHAALYLMDVEKRWLYNVEVRDDGVACTMLNDEMFDVLKRYTKHEEPAEDFLCRVTETINKIKS